MSKTEIVQLTEEDCLNISKWHTSVSLEIKAKIRMPFSNSEHETIVKISKAEGKLRTLRYTKE
jgi:hypothetical protein